MALWAFGLLGAFGTCLWTDPVGLLGWLSGGFWMAFGLFPRLSISHIFRHERCCFCVP